jgi:uncharacterized protein YceH (UPF0502 family)
LDGNFGKSGQLFTAKVSVNQIDQRGVVEQRDEPRSESISKCLIHADLCSEQLSRFAKITVQVLLMRGAKARKGLLSRSPRVKIAIRWQVVRSKKWL